MDKDRVQGKLEDMKGRAKRQSGEWTGDKKKQLEGAAEQIKGKVQNAWGNVKDAGREIAARTAHPRGQVPRRAQQNKHRPAA